MPDIETYLSQIISERFAKDVRQAIHDAIYQCYYDSKVGALDLIARQQIANLVSANNPTEGNSELHDIRAGADGIIYESAGEAVRQQIAEVTDKIAAILADETKDFATVEFDEETRMLHFYDESGVDVYEPVHIAGGGGGGGSTVSTVVKLINQNGSSTLAVAAGKTVDLKFTFISVEDDIPTGDGSCQITVNGVVKTTFNISQGLKVIDVSKFLTAGSNTVKVKCTDMYGNYRALVYTVSVIDLYITSTFDAAVTYDSDITFKFTPYGAIDKTVYILIDGKTFDTYKVSASGKQMTITIPKMSHGVHRLELYAAGELNGIDMESEHLFYDIMCVEANITTPIIASAYSGKPVTQGELISIPYIVYDPAKLACDITLEIYTYEDGKKIVYSTQSLTVDRQQRFWDTRKYPVGSVYFVINYSTGNISYAKTHIITVEESDINIEAESNDLELYLTSNGRSNDEAAPNRWSHGDITTNFSNMNWASSGWVIDENGDTCLRLNGDAKAEIQFKPFAEDLRSYGKTIEFEFAIRDVNDRDAVAISCMNGGIGLEVKPDMAYLTSEQSRVFCNYREEEKVRLSFVIESRSEHRLLSIYLNGVLSDIVQYPDSDNFQQSSPVNIVIGSEYCGIDLYTVRSYSTALTSQSIINNFIADMADIARKTITYENNDIYDEYGNISFEKTKENNSVMVITGVLPKSKGDKKMVKVSYYDLDNPNINYVDEYVEIDVQGTSSQYYVRKNWLLRCSDQHYIDSDHLPASVMCIKVDYAEATGTHNTQNANIIHTFYTEPIPPQVTEPKARTTIYGKPILLFYQPDSASDPIFYGKANYNYDKGAEHVFGFTSEYDVECWEFLNNTSDACLFLGEIPDNWADDFEARYPNKHKNISRFKEMHDWVLSTNGDIEKFKNEFEDHFDLHYSLIYYVYTFFALMVDQRAKNMFLTYWGSTGKWQPWFYDNDTCFGINNYGELVYDYYHEDTDHVDGENVYTGQNSLLWSNFREAFADEIKSTYQNLRNNGYITYDKMVNQFITEGSDKWSESVYNEDGEFKYVSMLRTDNDSDNLRRLRGSGEEHFRYFIKNRLAYCDSKWYASDYADDYVSLRISTPSTWAGVEPKADITLTAYSDVYAGIRYTANSSIKQQRVKQGESITFEASADDTFTGTETAIFGASQISSLGDLAPLYCGSIDVSKANKLTELKVGDSTSEYSNPNLKELSLGTNKLLKKLDIRNCSNLAISLDLSGCPNIEEVYAGGTAITGIELADSSCLRKALLPSSITNITIKNQTFIEEITFEGYAGLKTLWVENCPTFNTLTVLSNATNLERARLTNVNWSYADASALLALINRNISGIDEHGYNLSKMWIDGTCHIGTLTGSEMARIREAFPYLNITYDTLTAQLIYMSWDGTTELHRETVINGVDGVEDPVLTGRITEPTRTSTAQYDFTYIGWSKVIDGDLDETALSKVETDRYVYAAFDRILRSYTVKFYNDSTLLSEVITHYGYTATYVGDTPTKEGVGDDAIHFEFIGWDPEPINIQGDLSCYAQYYDHRSIPEDWATIAENSNYPIGSFKEVELTYEDGTTEIIEMEIIARDHDELTDDVDIASWEQYNIDADCIFNSGSAVVYHNEIHTFGGWDAPNSHCKYNGAEWVVVDNLIVGGAESSAVVFKDRIHLFGPSNDKFGHFEWDEDGGWGRTRELPIENPIAVVFKDYLHIFKGTKHYVYDPYTLDWVAKEDVPFTIMSPARHAIVVFNDCIHILGGYLSDKHYIYDGLLWTQATNPLPYKSTRPHAFVHKGELHLIGGLNGTNTDVSLKHYKMNNVGEWEELDDMPYPVHNTAFALSFREHINVITISEGLLVQKNKKAKYTFFVKNLPSKFRSGMSINGVVQNHGGFKTMTHIRTYLAETVMSALPESLRSVIKPVIKLSDTGYRTDYAGFITSTITSTEDKIWLLSAEELGLPESAYLKGQGDVYPVFTDNESRVRLFTNGTTTAPDGRSASWWTRSTPMSSTDLGTSVFDLDESFIYLFGGSGRAGYGPTSLDYFIAFGFCI